MTKQETLPKGVGVAKFDFTKHLEIDSRLQITVKVF